MSIGQDLRVAARGLAKRPGFAAVAVGTLALGIGANVAIFAIVNAVLLRPLPYPESDRLVWVRHHAPGLNVPTLESSDGTIALYREHARTLAVMAGIEQRDRNLTGGVEPARVRVAVVSPELFDVLRVEPTLGRRLLPADAREGAPPVAVLTHAGWNARFGGAPDVIGRTIELDGVATEIVGVMPEGYAYPAPETMLLLSRTVPAEPQFGTFGIRGIARLADGVTLEAARAEVTALQPRLTEMFPDLPLATLREMGWSATVEPMRAATVGDARTALWIVLGTVSFLLLVACASVANLFLVRADARRREVGIRVALGASRNDVAAAFLSESLLIGIGAGVIGMLLAGWGVRALVAAAPTGLPRIHEIGIDARTLLFAGALSVGAGLLLGLLPLPRQLSQSLRGLVRAGRGPVGGRDRQRLRSVLVVAQVAFSLVLLVGSGLMLRSFQRLLAVEPGIRPEGVVTLGVSLGEGLDRMGMAQTYARMLDDVRGLPGVAAAGATNAIPLDPGGINGSSFDIQSRPQPDDAVSPVVMYASVSEGYFEAIGTPVLLGRTMERADVDRPVAWVNQAFARAYLDDDALGERVRFGGDSTWLEVVGVVADVRTFRLREEARPQAYLPLATTVSSARIGLAFLVVRAERAPASLMPAMRAVARRVAPTTPLTTARTMDDVVRASLAQTTFTMTILAIAALVSLLLGAVGLYGVIGYVVSQRVPEIGLRIALGALPANVQRMVLRQGLALALTGVAFGLVGALLLSRMLASLLYGVSTYDPVTFGSVALVLLAVSAVAVWVPAARAAKTDPMRALQAE
jgi:putative ABC transport system permease protein